MPIIPNPDESPALLARMQELRTVLDLEGCQCTPHVQVALDAMHVEHRPGCPTPAAFYPADGFTGDLPRA